MIKNPKIEERKCEKWKHDIIQIWQKVKTITKKYYKALC